MRRARRVVAALLMVAVAACGRTEDAPAEHKDRDDEAPASLAGTSQDFGIAIKSVWLKKADAVVDARFEIQNHGRSIVNVQATDATAASEAVLSVETFRDGTWHRDKSAPTDPANYFDLWPGATLYARTTIPDGIRWARVVLRAKGLVGMKDGITVTRAMEVSSDAFEVTESR